MNHWWTKTTWPKSKHILHVWIQNNPIVSEGRILPRLLVFLRIFNSKDMNSTMITWNTQQFWVMVKVDTANNKWNWMQPVQQYICQIKNIMHSNKIKMLNKSILPFLCSSFWSFLNMKWVNAKSALNHNCELEIYGIFPVCSCDVSKQFHSHNNFLIYQRCSGPCC